MADTGRPRRENMKAEAGQTAPSAPQKRCPGGEQHMPAAPFPAQFDRPAYELEEDTFSSATSSFRAASALELERSVASDGCVCPLFGCGMTLCARHGTGNGTELYCPFFWKPSVRCRLQKKEAVSCGTVLLKKFGPLRSAQVLIR